MWDSHLKYRAREQKQKKRQPLLNGLRKILKKGSSVHAYLNQILPLINPEITF